MTAVTGVNLRSGEAYWELSGPIAINRVSSCRACRGYISKGEDVMVRDGRKLRFFYHSKCFTGNADPRTQEFGTYQEKKEYHENHAPKLSSLEGPRACVDADGRILGRAVFKPTAPTVLGSGKWSVQSRGYNPQYDATTVAGVGAASSPKKATSISSIRSSDKAKRSNILPSPSS